MPTYSYRCTECDHVFDIHQAFTDSTLTECPNCGGMLRKVFSPVGVAFSGSGFYRNDSRAPEKASSSSTSSSPAATPAAAAPAAASTQAPAAAAPTKKE